MSTYYLIADPYTGKCVHKSHRKEKPQEVGMMALLVDKRVWKSYRAGDLISIGDLSGYMLDNWLAAVRRRSWK